MPGQLTLKGVPAEDLALQPVGLSLGLVVGTSNIPGPSAEPPPQFTHLLQAILLQADDVQIKISPQATGFVENNPSS